MSSQTPPQVPTIPLPVQLQQRIQQLQRSGTPSGAGAVAGPNQTAAPPGGIAVLQNGQQRLLVTLGTLARPAAQAGSATSAGAVTGATPQGINPQAVAAALARASSLGSIRPAGQQQQQQQQQQQPRPPAGVAQNPQVLAHLLRFQQQMQQQRAANQQQQQQQTGAAGAGAQPHLNSSSGASQPQAAPTAQQQRQTIQATLQQLRTQQQQQQQQQPHQQQVGTAPAGSQLVSQAAVGGPSTLSVIMQQQTAARIQQAIAAARQQQQRMQEQAHERRLENADGGQATDVDGTANVPLEDEEQEEGEIYSMYRPAKVTGQDHPDVIVETATLASVVPPDPTYTIHSGVQDDVEAGRLSSAQHETLVYANMRFNGPRLPGGARAGFFLGDGAGVGKGRQIAALIKEYWLTRRKKAPKRVLWVSTSTDLRFDARRDLKDLRDLGSSSRQVVDHIHVVPKDKDALPKGRLSQAYKEGVLFVTYSLLAMGNQVPGVKTGPLAKALQEIHNPRQQTPASSRGGRGGGRGRGRGRGRGSSSWATSLADDLTTGAEDPGEDSASIAPAGWEEQDGEDFGGGRGGGRGARGSKPKPKWKRAPNTALERAAGELIASDIQPGTRLWQIVEWLAEADDGDVLIVLDECHRAKNLVATEGRSTKTGIAVLALQNALPNARVVYSSATGASEPSNMAYMVRMLPMGFVNTYDMIKTLQTAGLGSLELFCMGLKAMGSYLARTLSYHGANFVMDDVQLAPQFRVQYDRAAEFWQLLWQVMCPLFSGMENRMGSLRSRQFWSAHQRFFRQMLMAAKVPSCAALALDAVNKEGMCVVIGLQSTGEANTAAARESAGDELDDLVSAPRMVLQQYIDKWFPDDPADLPRMSDRAIKKLLLDVYKVAKQWEGLPSADEMAAVERREKRLREKRRVQRQAAAAGVLVPQPQQQQQLAALPAPDSAAAAAAAGEGSEDDDEPIEVVADLSVDQILAVRRSAAARQGLLVDLTTEAPEAELAAAQAELEQLERAEDDAQRAAAVANRRKALEEAVAEAQQEVDEAQALLEGNRSSPSRSRSPSPSAAESSGDGSPDSMDVDEGNPAAAAAAAGRGGSTKRKAQQQQQPKGGQASAGAAARKRQRGASGQVVDVSGSPSPEEDGDGSEEEADPTESPQPEQQQEKEQQPAAAAKGGRPSRAAAAASRRRSSAQQAAIDDSSSGSDGEQDNGKPQQQQQQQQQRKSRLSRQSNPSAAAAAAGGGSGEGLEDEVADEVADEEEGAAAVNASHPKHRRALVRDSDTDSDDKQQQGQQRRDAGKGRRAAAAAAAGSSGSDGSGSEEEQEDDDARALREAAEAEEDATADRRRRDARQLMAAQRKQASEMRGRKGGMTDAVRQIAARRRLERAQLGLLRASAALEEFDREQRGSAPSSPAADDADAGAADEQAVPATALQLVAERITRGVAFKGTQVISAGAAAGTLTGYRHSVSTKALGNNWEKEMDLGISKRGRRAAAVRARSTSRAAAAAAAAGDDGSSSEDDAGARGDGSSSDSDDLGSSSSSASSSDSGSGSDSSSDKEEGADSDVSGSTRAGAGRRGGCASRGRNGSRASTPAAAREGSVKDEGVKAESKPDTAAAGAGGGLWGRRGGVSAAAASRGSSLNLRLDADDLEVAGLQGFRGFAATRGDDDEQAVLLARIKRLLLRMVSALELPANPLDQLIELLGGESKVAEMTGRKGLLVRGADGKVTYRQRGEDLEVSQKLLNIQEKNSFMEGKKLFAIISDAASTGISLQADKRVRNKRRRCHITLELPWSADKAIQQFGRSHRSNQESAPIYHLLMTPVGGERRFAGAVAKRLSSLGALLQGDRRAVGAGESLREFDIDNRWGRDALARLYDDVSFRSLPMPGVKLPEPDSDEEEDNTPAPLGRYYGGSDQQARFFRRLGLAFVRVGLMDEVRAGPGWMSGSLSVKEAVKKSVPRFLNRLLGLSLADQRAAFAYFQSVFDATVLAAKSRGEYDSGIRSVGAPMTLTARRLLHTDKASGATTAALTLNADMGLPFEGATAALEECVDLAVQHGEAPSPHNGFYIDKTVTNWGGSNHPRIMLVTQVAREATGQTQSFQVRRPNNGFDRHRRTLRDIQDYWKPLKNLERAQEVWTYWFDHAKTGCMHGPSCARRADNKECHWGGRQADVQMISGAVLPLWKLLHEVVSKSVFGRNADTGEKKKTIQVQRGQLTDGSPVIGMTMHKSDFELVLNKIEDLEATGGVEAAGRALVDGTGIWADMENVWAPDDDWDDGQVDVAGMQLLRRMGLRDEARAADGASGDEDEDDEDEEGGKDNSSSSGSSDEEQSLTLGDTSSSDKEGEEDEDEDAPAAAAAAGGRKQQGSRQTGSRSAGPARRPATTRSNGRAAGGRGGRAKVRGSSSSSEQEEEEQQQQRRPAARGRGRPPQTQQRSTRSRTPRQQQPADSSSGGEDEEDSDSPPAAAAAANGGRRPTRQAVNKRKPVTASSSSSSDEEEEQAAAAGRQQRSSRGRGWPTSSSSRQSKRKKRTPEEVLKSMLLGSQRAQEIRNSSLPTSGAAGTPAAGGSADTSGGAARRGGAAAAAAAALAGAAAALRGAGGSKQQQQQGRGRSGSVEAGGTAGAVSPDAEEVIEISDSD